METLILNPEKLEEVKALTKKDGYENLHILSDFDRTLTYGTVDGVKIPSIIALLRDGDYLSDDYAKKAHALFEKYHPFEKNLELSREERKKAMENWWKEHHELLIRSGLSKKNLEDILEKETVKFREGVLDFLDFLNQKKIPLIILSASGCGDVVRMFFQKNKKDYPNIHYVVNQFNWNEEGRAISPKGRVIHSMSKDEAILKEIPQVYEEIKERKNVILLGDSIDDLGMVEGFDYHHLIKIGFLNPGYYNLREDYEKNFDVIIEGDGDFSYVNNLMRDLS